MQLDNLPLESLAKIAWALFDVHGEEALCVADKAIFELESEGLPKAANAWRGVKCIVEDVSLGRMTRHAITIH